MSEYHRRTIMCLNCGRIGHENKSCREPKSSFGIINLKIDIPERYRDFLLAQFVVPHHPVLKVKSRVHPDIQCFISDGIKITQELYYDSDHQSGGPTWCPPGGRDHQSGGPIWCPPGGRDHQSGNYRSGDYQSGDYQSGDHQSGNYRSGDYQSGDHQSEVSTWHSSGSRDLSDNKKIIINDQSDKTDTQRISTNIDGSILLTSYSRLEFFELLRYKIQFMMVSRKFSLAIIDFLKGKYNPNDTGQLLKYFQEMMQSEIDMIKKYDYDDLVYIVMNKDKLSKEDFLNQLFQGNHAIDYNYAKKSFNRLKYPVADGGEKDCGIIWNLHFYTNIQPKWTEPEWGFPKGKRSGKTESNLECAIREFNEETGFSEDEFIPMNNLEPLVEYLIGTDNAAYRNVYYMAFNNIKKDKPLEFDYYETGQIKFFFLEEALEKIRPYHNKKKHILVSIYTFFMNYLINLIQPEKID